MEVFTVYVGQGALAAIRHQREAVIVDSRWPTERSETIEHQLRVFLKDHWVAGLVLTGFDDDHADPFGVDHILGVYQPDWVMYPKYYKDTKNATRVFNVMRKHERRRERTSQPLCKISVRLDCLDSRVPQDLLRSFEPKLFSPHIEDMDNSNDCSIVLKLTGIGLDGFSYLVTGDTENARWDTITRLFGRTLKADVLSAPHHGSKNASHPKMVRLVSPNTVLISAGVDNPYGHPDSQALKIYQRVAQHVFQTNVQEGASLIYETQWLQFSDNRSGLTWSNCIHLI